MLATPELLQEAAQPSRLSAELARCVQEIPLYQEDKGRAGGSGPLENWRLITKENIRRNFPANFLGPDLDLEYLLQTEVAELEHTSGTSEVRTPLLLPKGWWAEQEQKALSLNHWIGRILAENPSARRATINSPICSGDIRYNGVPSMDERVVGSSLFVSLSRFPFLWGQRDLDRIASEIIEWRPEFLDVDPVYGVVFALYCEAHGIRIPSLRFIICSYEFVSVVHRAILKRVFGVPVLDLYGSTETGHLLMEDEQGEMRPSLETAFFEVIETDEFGVGNLVVTTLSNPLMPLIRYRIGDLVERSDTPYGSRYVLHGRVADAFHISGESRFTTRQVDQCFLNTNGIAHYQLLQMPPRRWLLKYVPQGEGPEPSELSMLQDRLRSLLQSVEPINLLRTDVLAPESSGKFRLGYPASKP